ncbi:MAG: Ku protein [Betaproteobacteria bacterium]
MPRKYPAKPAASADTAVPSRRTIWKGSITFGLVYIPVALYPASKEDGLDFDWLDKRDMAPVGYKRVNKVTGKEVTKENIVKGLAYQEGRYAILTDEEIRATHPKSTQTVELLSFVDEGEIAPEYFEKPYYLAPTAKGEKVYSLLRETLRKEKKIGIAYVVIATKQHLAALIPGERALMLLLLRWNTEIRGEEGISVPPAGKSAGVKPAELAMATQLVKSMSGKWNPADYEDTFRGEIMALVKKKVAAGKTTEILPADAVSEERPSAKILDLTDLLKRSLKSGGKSSAAAKGDDSESAVPKRKAVVSKITSAKSSAAKSRAGKTATTRAAAKRKPATQKKSA